MLVPVPVLSFNLYTDICLRNLCLGFVGLIRILDPGSSSEPKTDLVFQNIFQYFGRLLNVFTLKYKTNIYLWKGMSTKLNVFFDLLFFKVLQTPSWRESANVAARTQNSTRLEFYNIFTTRYIGTIKNTELRQ